MLSKGVVMKLHPFESQEGFYSTLFLVPKKDGRTRPVINLKRLNEFISPQDFKMEGMHTVRDLLRENDWLTKVNQKNAYFMVPIHEIDRKYLRFSVKGTCFSIHLPPLRSIVCPFDLYQDPEASDGNAQRTRGEASVLYRRHSGDGRLLRKGERPYIVANFSSREARLHSTFRESGHNSNTRDQVSGYDNTHPSP